MAEKVKEIWPDATQAPRPRSDSQSVPPWVKTIPSAEAMSWIRDLADGWEHEKGRLTAVK